MSDWTLPLESTEAQRDFNVGSSAYENLASESRLLTAGAVVGWKCKSSALTYAQLQLYLAFFDSKYGSLISFTFTPKTEAVEYTVKFVKGSFKYSHSGGVYQCEFSLEKFF